MCVSRGGRNTHTKRSRTQRSVRHTTQKGCSSCTGTDWTVTTSSTNGRSRSSRWASCRGSGRWKDDPSSVGYRSVTFLSRYSHRDWLGGVQLGESGISQWCDMECSKKPRDGTHPHTRRVKTCPGRSNQGNSNSRQLLTDETGWYSGSTVYREEVGVFCILEFKHMSDVMDQYLLRTRLKTENQYESLRHVLSDTIHRQGWKVEPIRRLNQSAS